MPLDYQKDPRELREDIKRLKVEEILPKNDQACLSNALDVFEGPPPKTENELLQMYYWQRSEIHRLRELIQKRDIQIKCLELELTNLRMNTGNY